MLVLTFSSCSFFRWQKAPGVCFRLYTESHFETLRDATLPEIRRSNLASVILQLKRLGVEDVRTFDYIEKPAADARKKKRETLLFFLLFLFFEC